jgi:hypothetical protein
MTAALTFMLKHLVGAVQKVKSPLKTKNHKHRYINVSKTFKGVSLSRKNDLLDSPCFISFDHVGGFKKRNESISND